MKAHFYNYDAQNCFIAVDSRCFQRFNYMIIVSPRRQYQYLFKIHSYSGYSKFPPMKMCYTHCTQVLMRKKYVYILRSFRKTHSLSECGLLLDIVHLRFNNLKRLNGKMVYPCKICPESLVSKQPKLL